MEEFRQEEERKSMQAKRDKQKAAERARKEEERRAKEEKAEAEAAEKMKKMDDKRRAAQRKQALDSARQEDDDMEAEGAGKGKRKKQQNADTASVKKPAKPSATSQEKPKATIKSKRLQAKADVEAQAGPSNDVTLTTRSGKKRIAIEEANGPKPKKLKK